MVFYDSHAHLNLDEFENEYLALLETYLKDQNLLQNVVGVDWTSSLKAIEIAKKYQTITKALVGIHPNDAYLYEKDLDIFNKLENLVVNNLDVVSGIGEIGLDFFRNKSDEKIQFHFLEKQAEIAFKNKLVVMLHLRDAFLQIKDFIKRNEKQMIVIHCFNQGIEQAEFYLKHNCYLSIPGVVTFKNAKALQEAIKIIPVDKLLTETDSPYLTPVPYRGQKNYPHYVQFSLFEIAKIKQINQEELAKIVLENSLKVFKWNK